MALLTVKSLNRTANLHVSLCPHAELQLFAQVPPIQIKDCRQEIRNQYSKGTKNPNTAEW